MGPKFSREGTIDRDVPHAGQCSTWYGVVGTPSPTNPPLILAHGGPGAGHSYLVYLSYLHTHYGIPLIFYDQLGCGRSTHLPHKAGDESFWTVDLFISELDDLIDFFELRDSGFYFYGQSWGGMLGGAWASRRPLGLRKLVLADAPASVPLMGIGVQGLVAQLPEGVRKALEEADREGDWESDEYKEACMVFYKRHVCRLEEWPECLEISLRELEEDPTVYGTMYGPSELTVTGNLKEWEGFSQAHKIDVETLLINGRYDEVQDISVAPWFHAIPKVKWIQLEKSSHMGHLEQPERYMRVIAAFLGSEKALQEVAHAA
ncbi:prolyl aminopeptidase [Lophiostoma macrostomum CBS 122681]|uniref:Prolyl aminopeptidase n=1 Tax=Lophiostoma macrostomum CBS 122681 TaxID=1314788 RepID=A0A6A6T0P0_9PLEO|nr:prolyl aminopeptidase [Lophiostoma macrostomum CBS 122681]